MFHQEFAIFDLVSKFNVRLKSLPQQGLSEPEFYGNLTNYIVAYEEIQSNRVSEFRDVLCFQRQSFLTFSI